jgi:transcriptional regulator with XRE-family HTH domain
MGANYDNFISENLKYIRSIKKQTQEDFAEALSIKRSTYRDYENGTNEPPISFLQIISAKFQLPIDKIIKKKLSAIDFIHQNNDLKILTISVDNFGNELIDFVPVSARAGYLSGYGDAEYISGLQKFRLPGLPQGSYRAFEIEGDSMLPLEAGTVVIGQFIENWREIKNLNTYVIVTQNDGIVFKRIINRGRDKGKLVMISDNPIYEPYLLNLSEIKEIWAYYAHISFSSANSKEKLNDIMLRLKLLGNDIGNLEDIIKP